MIRIFRKHTQAADSLYMLLFYETYENVRKQLECGWKFVIILPVFG